MLTKGFTLFPDKWFDCCGMFWKRWITSLPAMSFSSSSLTSPFPIRAFSLSFSAFSSLLLSLSLSLSLSLPLSWSLPLSLSPLIHCDPFQSKSDHLHIAELAWSAFQWGPRSQWLSSWFALRGPLWRVFSHQMQSIRILFTSILYLNAITHIHLQPKAAICSSIKRKNTRKFEQKKGKSPHLRKQREVQEKRKSPYLRVEKLSS